MKNLKDILAGTDAYWESCERMTGKTQAEWEQTFRARVKRGLGGNNLTARRTHTLDRINGLCRYYGIDFDLYCEQVVMPLDSTDEKTKFEMGAETVGWRGTGRSGGMCNLVYRYKFKAEALADLGKALEEETSEARRDPSVTSESTQAENPHPNEGEGDRALDDQPEGPWGLPF